MSSPLDGRIRAIAREEAGALLGVGSPDAAADGDGTDRTAELEREVAALRATLEEFGARLDAVEKTGQEERTPTRRTRKPSGE
ncbi:hypothetical protein QA802_08010 [Streptomyces sp. B21-105]|uniref:hypothetical protein n=1 Tax=Streptomyces sp. B21-105 TaxID=3039417 RepID=UPI002FF3E950